MCEQRLGQLLLVPKRDKLAHERSTIKLARLSSSEVQIDGRNILLDCALSRSVPKCRENSPKSTSTAWYNCFMGSSKVPRDLSSTKDR